MKYIKNVTILLKFNFEVVEYRVAFYVLTEVCHTALNVAKTRLAAEGYKSQNPKYPGYTFLKCLQLKQFQCFFKLCLVFYLEE